MPLRSATALAATLCASMVCADTSIETTPPGDLAWEITPEGVAFAPLVGDRFAEPYMAMVRLPAGLVSPPHVKSADMFGVMVAGEMTHVALDAEADSAPRLPAGAFYRVPADVAHVSACVSEVDCVTFLYQDGAFDFEPVTP